jgi:very-short-patch-repair endonuclease
MNKVRFARRLRREPTDAERKIWARPRDRRFCGYKFRRQVPIGPYIADFACLPHKVIIELDGGQHVQQEAYDERRDAWLRAQGFRVLRFWDDVALKETDVLLEVVWNILQGSPLPARAPSPRTHSVRLGPLP